MIRRVLYLAATCLWLGCWSAAQRLPKIAVPSNYKLTLSPDFSQDKFDGQETIQIQVLKPTSEIVLNAADLNIHEVSIASREASQKAEVVLDAKNETVTLSVARTLQPGSAMITIGYTGTLNQELRGFYLGREEDGKKYAGTQMEATDARRAFPCFDEPEYKATFDITVVADQQHTVISNSKIVLDAPGPADGKHTVTFATTPKISSYLVAVVVGDFEYVEGSADGIPIRVYTTPGRKKLAGYGLVTAEQSIKYFDQYFGIKYPFGKLDLIALPDFAPGAMENPGAIVSREVLLLVDDQHSTLNQRRIVDESMAHEIAHQWFGDLVTLKWWDDSWLNEGFAMWMQDKSVATWSPEMNVLVDDVLSPYSFLGPDATLAQDSLVHTHPVHQAAETPGQITELFDAISYGKGASLLWMVEAYLGPEVFRKGVDTYLNNHSYGNATSEDFWSSLAAVSEKPVDRIMKDFIYQAGVPIVSVASRCTGDSTSVTLSQQRYFTDRQVFSAGNDELWSIPVCMKAGMASGQTREQCVLLSKKQEDFTLPGCASWVLGNADARGYYRTGYDSAAVRALLGGLETALTPSERIRLLSDEWASVSVGRQTIADYLAVVNGLRGDNDVAVLDMEALRLAYIERYLVSDADRNSYQQWVRELLMPLAKDLGWRSAAGDSEDRKNLRARVLMVLGSTGRDTQVLDEASKLARQTLDRRDSVDPTIAAIVLQLAAINGDTELYDKTLDRMRKAASPQEASQLLGVLINFTDPQLLDRTLKLAMTVEIRNQDTTRMLAGVMNNPAGERLGWDFVREHWEEITKKLGGYNTSANLVGTTGGFCDAEIRDQVKDFFVAHPIPDAERTLQQSLEQINHCIDLKAHESSQLASWLEHRANSVGE